MSVRSRPAPPAEAQADIPQIESTITFLEMLEPPRVRPAQPLAGPTQALLPVEQPTVSFYRFLYNSVGTDWLWFERRMLSDAQLRSILRDPANELWVLYRGGQPAGYAELDFRRLADLGVVGLSYFGLLPDFIGLKLGPYLLHAALERAWSKDPRRVTVNTCTLDHPSTLPLYRRMGFQPIGRKTRVFDDPRFTGLIPRENQARARPASPRAFPALRD